jgi:hypothetical protein
MSHPDPREFALYVGLTLAIIGIIAGVLGIYAQFALAEWIGAAFFVAGLFSLIIGGLIAYHH